MDRCLLHLLLASMLLASIGSIHSMSVPFRAESQIRVEETPAEAFARSDRNGDGKLNFEEFMHTDALFEALKKDEFGQLDTNSDGRVSRREEYYPSGGWYSGVWKSTALGGEEPPPLLQFDNLPQQKVRPAAAGTSSSVRQGNQRIF